VPDEIVFRFPEEGIAAPARLLGEREAPATCRAVMETLPVAGLARHGIYSGSEIYLVLPGLLSPPREHATTIVRPGDVGFLTVQKGSGYGIDEERTTRRSAGSTTTTRRRRCPRDRSP